MEWPKIFRKKTQEEKEVEAELKQVQEQLKHDKELLSGKKPSSVNTGLKIGLAAAIAAGGGGIYLGTRDKNKEEKLTNLDTVAMIDNTTKKEGQPGFVAPTNVSITDLAKQIKTNTIETPIPESELKAMQIITPEPAPRIEEPETQTLMPPSPAIQLGKNITKETKSKIKTENKSAPKTLSAKELEKQKAIFEQMEKEMNAPMEQGEPGVGVEKERIVQPKVVKNEFPPANELEAAQVRAKLETQYAPKPKWNRTITTGTTMQIGQTPSGTIEEIRQETPNIPGVKITSRGPGGANTVWSSNPDGIGFDNPAMMAERLKKTFEENSLNLSEESLEKVNKIFNGNMGKLFPHKSESSLRKILNQGVYDFLDKTGQKIEKGRRVSADDKNLYEHLVKLQRISGVMPGDMTSQKPQTVGAYIEKALKTAEKNGKLDQVTIK